MFNVFFNKLKDQSKK